MDTSNKYDRLLKENDRKLSVVLKITTILLVLISMLYYVNFNLIYFITNLSNASKPLWQMTGGVFVDLFTGTDLRSYFMTIQGPMMETIQMSLLGTLLGAIIGFIFALLSSEIFMPSSIVRNIFRLLGSVLRSVPTLMYAAIFVVIFGSGATGGIMAVTLFSVTIIAKIMYENIDEIDKAPVEALDASGARKIYVIRYAVIPQIMPVYISTILFTFEINVRASLILGYVGAGGIGENLQSSFSNLSYTRVGLIVIYTYIIVVIIDLISNAIRKRLI